MHKKTFKWKLLVYNDNSIAFDIKFDNPKYISNDGIDTMKISFQHTNDFMMP